MTRRLASLVLLTVVTLSACASVTSPAVEVDGVDYDRNDLTDFMVEALGVDDPAALGIDQAGPAINEFIATKLQAVVLDEVETRGIEPTGDDRAALGVGPDFEPPPEQAEAFEFQLRLTALQRGFAESGENFDAWVDELVQSVSVDPRYGTWGPDTGLVPPELPAVEGGQAPLLTGP